MGRDIVGTIVVVLAGMGMLIGLAAYSRHQQNTINNLRTELAIAEARSRSASATIMLLRAELESDAAVDNLSDDDLRNAPSIWMRGTETGR